MIKTNDPTGGALKNYQITRDGTVHMGTKLTIFQSTRIKAGFTADKLWYHCDWCCGENFFCIATTYKIMEVLLDSGISLLDLPTMSMVKPWPLDVAFVKKLEELMKRVGYPLALMPVRELLLEPEFHIQLKRGY